MPVKNVFVLVFVISVGFYLFTCKSGLAAEASAGFSSCNNGGLLSVSAVSASILSSNDTNWAGYAVVSDIQNPQANVTGVSASWAVPEVIVSSEDKFSAVWIGIGGFFDNSLIQTGTEQDSIQEQSEYLAWIEFLPQTSITLDTVNISPGDQITASIQLVDSTVDQWAIYFKDRTTNQEYTNSFIYVSSQLSAEWIVERPELTSPRSRGTLTNLTDIGTVTFTDCHAIIGGQNGTIRSFPTVQSIMYQTISSTTDSGSMLIATVSDLTDNGSSFTVETSPSAIPELSALMLIPLIVGASLIAAIDRKRTRIYSR